MREPAMRTADDALSVSQVTARIKESLESEFSDLWVAGEISDLSQSHAGHLYFTLKDAQAQLRAVIWASAAARLKFRPQDGLEVLCRGEINVYPPRGSYQLMVRSIEPRGAGAQQLALRKLQAKLSAEGLFDPRRKRPLPRFARRVAIVTSPTGAAVRDFLEAVRRRWPAMSVCVIPARVQGEGAAAQIVRGIELAARLADRPDVLVVARGGGSVDDLACFNDEAVVRAVYGAPFPVVSAVGHEIDVTLSDLTADVRAMTPTEAAELVTPSRDELRAGLLAAGRRLRQALQRKAVDLRLRLDRLAARRCFRRPFDPVQERARRLDELAARAERAVRRRRRAEGDRVAAIAARLESLSPLGVLQRGYGVTRRVDDGELVRDAAELTVGRRVTTRLARGQFTAVVESIDAASADGPPGGASDEPGGERASGGANRAGRDDAVEDDGVEKETRE